MTHIQIAVDRRFSDPSDQRGGFAEKPAGYPPWSSSWRPWRPPASRRADLLRYLPDNPVIDNAILVEYGLTETVDGKVVPDPVYFDRTVKDNDGRVVGKIKFDTRPLAASRLR